MVLGLRSLKQMKLDETRDTVKVTISIKPYLLEFSFRALTRKRFIAMNIMFLREGGQCQNVVGAAMVDREREPPAIGEAQAELQSLLVYDLPPSNAKWHLA
jgi:hypothetical protein